MPAHLRTLHPAICGCGKKATVTLYSGENARIADYCDRCAQKALVRQSEIEARNLAQRRA